MISLKHDFRLALALADTWAAFTDLGQLASCLPGASVDEVVDGMYRGRLTAKLGPISGKYSGEAQVREADEVARRLTIEARGREIVGQGTARAAIFVEMSADGTGTSVHVTTELEIAGRAAQFGRGILEEVSHAILRQFIANLESLGAASPTTGPGATTGSVVRGSDLAPTTPSLDVWSVLVKPMVSGRRDVGVAAMVGFAAGLLVAGLLAAGIRRRDRCGRPERTEGATHAGRGHRF